MFSGGGLRRSLRPGWSGKAFGRNTCCRARVRVPSLAEATHRCPVACYSAPTVGAQKGGHGSRPVEQSGKERAEGGANASIER